MWMCRANSRKYIQCLEEYRGKNDNFPSPLSSFFLSVCMMMMIELVGISCGNKIKHCLHFSFIFRLFFFAILSRLFVYPSARMKGGMKCFSVKNVDLLNVNLNIHVKGKESIKGKRIFAWLQFACFVYTSSYMLIFIKKKRRERKNRKGKKMVMRYFL